MTLEQYMAAVKEKLTGSPICDQD